MIEIKKEDILKVSPDYEAYTENEAKLTIDELKELAGVEPKKSCCGKSGGCSSGGCSSSGSCCKTK